MNLVQCIISRYFICDKRIHVVLCPSLSPDPCDVANDLSRYFARPRNSGHGRAQDRAFSVADSEVSNTLYESVHSSVTIAQFQRSLQDSTLPTVPEALQLLFLLFHYGRPA